MIKFGPSGNSIAFAEAGNKTSEQSAVWVKNLGLNCFEYSFGRGVNLSDERAVEIGKAFEAAGVEISVHAPYYINFANPEELNAENSYGYVIRSAEKLILMGGRRLVFHPASQGKMSREKAVDLTAERLKVLRDRIYEQGLNDLTYCPETMGKIGQIGTVSEAVDIKSGFDLFNAEFFLEISASDFCVATVGFCGCKITIRLYIPPADYMKPVICNMLLYTLKCCRIQFFNCLIKHGFSAYQMQLRVIIQQIASSSCSCNYLINPLLQIPEPNGIKMRIHHDMNFDFSVHFYYPCFPIIAPIFFKRVCKSLMETSRTSPLSARPAAIPAA